MAKKYVRSTWRPKMSDKFNMADAKWTPRAKDVRAMKGNEK